MLGENKIRTLYDDAILAYKNEQENHRYGGDLVQGIWLLAKILEISPDQVDKDMA